MYLLEALKAPYHYKTISRAEVVLLLEHITGLSNTQLHTLVDYQLTYEQQQHFTASLHRLAAGEPLPYIIGYTFFDGLKINVTPDVLIPRPDSEHLIYKAAGLFKKQAIINILDLGTGSAALAIALAQHYSNARVWAVERSLAALKTAYTNVQRFPDLTIRLLWQSWFGQLPHNFFNLIIANPPYIAPDDPHLLQLVDEPQQALTAPQNGLADLAFIIKTATSYLVDGGVLMVEHGYQQGQPVRNLFAQATYANITTEQDFGHNERLTRGQKQSHQPLTGSPKICLA